MNQVRVQWKMKSKVGYLYLVASQKGLQGVFWERQNLPLLKSLTENSPQAKILAQAVQELSEYLNSERTKFSLAYDIKGTDFQKRVWDQLKKIPYGQTTSYKQIAEKIKSKAIRAVGSANAKNPLSILVPCHRVITSSGSLGGYSGGLKIKARLIQLEKQKLDSLT